MHRLVLLRHGESTWNKENRFTGWVDVDLSPAGVAEAVEAGKQLKRDGFVFDTAFTSVLKRAIRTLWLVLDEMDLMWVPVQRSWRLNERHYGALQGLDKTETAQLHGKAQVLLWRRSYDTSPPPLDPADQRYPGPDPRYADLAAGELPSAEALKDTMRRLLPYWEDAIAPAIKSGQRVLIAAHGNSLRVLVKHLDQVADPDIVDLNIPTGVPLVYELDDDLTPLKHYYLGDPEAVQKAVAQVSEEGRAAS